MNVSDLGPDLGLRIGTLKLKNPVMTASGTCGYGQELTEFYDPARLGCVVVKGLSIEPRPGNPPPRVVETSSGMLNSIGLENVGLKVFIKEKLPWLHENGVTTAVNILGDTVAEYEALAKGLDQADGVHLIEVNVSCPNVEEGGLSFGVDPIATQEVVRAVTGATSKPVMVKLTPLVSDIVEVAVAAAKAGASAISLINTLPGMAVDIESQRPILGNIIGGLSGPAIKPVALKLVWQVAKAVDIPVVGVGGITTPEDALEFLLVGAKAVQVGTASFIDPLAPVKILEGIEKFFKENSIEKLSDWVGSLKV